MHYARDHSVQDGLTQVLALNSAMLQTEDIAVVLKAVRIFEHVCLRKHCYCVPHPYFIDTRARLMMTPVSTVGTRKERQSDLSGFTLKKLKCKAVVQQPDSIYGRQTGYS